VGFELLEEAAYQEQPRENSFYSLIYGLLLTMVLFNFFFILASGMTIYRGYLYFGITILFYFMIAHGNLDLFCPLPYSFSWSSICNSVAGLAALSLFQHQRYILSTRTNMPRLDRCFAIGLAGISFGMLTPVPQLRYLAGIVGDYSILYAVLLSLAIGVVGIKRKISGAIAFMVGFGILGFALFLFQLQLLGFIPVDSRSDLFFELGVSGQMLAMALGIGLSLQKTIREKIKVSQLAQLNKLKAESAKTMLSLLSHDLNNPLSVIAGTASLMKNRYGSDTKDHQMWDMVAKAAQQEHEILVSARKLIEIDSINFHLRPTTIQAEDLHDQIMFIFKERLVAKNISFVSNLKDNPLSFTSDRSILFSNVIGNIMSNAIKFSSPGGVIRLELKEQEGQIVIAVSDEGIGMSQQILRQFNGEELLTQTFKRPGTSGESGSGFGLAIVKKTTEELQGTMIISSKEATELDPTHGTTVTITLPKTLAKTHQIA
jgi:signal transduction histidine kinase